MSFPLLWLTDATRVPLTGSGSWATSAGPIRPKGLIHTTETLGWPGYSGGKSAPHVSAKPLPGVGVEVRQHFPFDTYGRSLVHATGQPETNRYPYVFQIELLGTCDPARKGELYYWPEADDAVLRDLYAKVIAPLNAAYGIPMRAPGFKAYPGSYGNNGVRMSDATFQGYTGWLGHEHAPQNDHGDPGAFPWARLVALVAPAPAPAPKPHVDYPVIRKGAGMPPAHPHGWVERLQRDLNAHGYHLVVDGKFWNATEAAVRDYQAKHGLLVDGVAGPQTFGSLEA